MNNTINNKTRIIFENEIGPYFLIEKILKKYQLEETEEEIYKKIIEEDKKTNIPLIILKIKDLFLKKMKEEDFIFFLKEILKTEERTIKKILEDIKKDILPIMKEIIVKKDSKENIDSKIIKSIKISKILGLEK